MDWLSVDPSLAAGIGLFLALVLLVMGWRGLSWESEDMNYRSKQIRANVWKPR